MVWIVTFSLNDIVLCGRQANCELMILKVESSLGA